LVFSTLTLFLSSYTIAAERANIFQKKAPGTAVKSTPTSATNVKKVAPATAKVTKAKKDQQKIVKSDLLSPAQLKIPSEYGSVKEYWPHDPNAKFSKLIIHIQDAHCNYEAQMNLAKMLEYLYLAHGNTLILVEGGSRSDSLSYMRAYAPKEKRIEVADKYLKMGKICGENYLDITEDYPIDVFGIEKPELYDSNMTSFLKLDEIRDKDLVLLDNLNQAANALKEKIYPAGAIELEAKKKDYTDEKLKFKDYAEYLTSGLNEKERLSLAREGLTNIILYGEALGLEKKTDLKQTELERTKLLEKLTKTLPQATLKDCLAKTQLAKDGKIKQSEYYNYLKSLITSQNQDPKIQYPNLFAYIDYLTVFDQIDNDALFKELPLLEDKIYEKLFGKSKEASELYFISKAIETFGALIEIKITPDETKFYTENKNKFKVREWKNFLIKQSQRFGLSTNLNPESTVLDNHFAFVDSFYNVAQQREEAFLKNSLKAMDERLAAPENQAAPKIAVLICGGYHTATLMDLFKSQNIAYVVVAPNVTTPTDKNLYRTVLKEVYTPMAGQIETAPAAKPALPGMLRPQTTGENKQQ